MTTRKRKEFGPYIVADPEICGGQLTFKGTRIFVQDVLAMLAIGAKRRQAPAVAAKIPFLDFLVHADRRCVIFAA